MLKSRLQNIGRDDSWSGATRSTFNLVIVIPVLMAIGGFFVVCFQSGTDTATQIVKDAYYGATSAEYRAQLYEQRHQQAQPLAKPLAHTTPQLSERQPPSALPPQTDDSSTLDAPPHQQTTRRTDW